jgi:hypothetical protein
MDTLIDRLNRAGARYLVIGGQAMRLWGLPRFSMDWDLFVPPRDESNLHAIEKALADELDVALLPLGPRGENLVQTYQTRFGIVQFHLVVPGLASFEVAQRHAVRLADEDGCAVPCLSARDLLATKLATHRAQDQQDIAFLEELLARHGHRARGP